MRRTPFEQRPARSDSAPGAGGATAGGGVVGGATLPLVDASEGCAPSRDDGELGAVPAVLVDGVGDELDDAGVLAVVLGDAADERTVATEEAVVTSRVDGAEGAEGEADTSMVGEPLAHGLKCSLEVAADLATRSEMGCVACDISRWSVRAG